VSDCAFCRIAAGEAPAELIFENEATVAFMDVNPATDGHCLVIPRTHADDVWSLPDADGEAVWRTVRRVASAVREALRPDGLNLFQSNGRAAFQTVFHFHVHVIPRYGDDPIRLPWIPTPGDRNRIAEFARKLRPVL